jgi:beta-lactamase class A
MEAMGSLRPLAASLLAAAGLAACASPVPAPAPAPTPIAPVAIAPAPAPPRPAPSPPAGLAEALQTLGRGFDGRAGIAVEAVQGGWTAAYDGQALYPQQSVSKLCTALALLDAVDRGQRRLSEPVLVRREDMSVFHQPIQAKLTDTGFPTTLGELLSMAIADSDNAAEDILMRQVGGPDAVQAAVAARGLQGVRCGPEEHLLESKIAGLDWKPEYSFGQTFWTARDQVDPALRIAKLNAYLADPDDGAAPLAIVRLLARLDRGELLSPASTALLLEMMGRTRTGPLRLPAGLSPGWRIAHKTGTGQDLGDLSTGNNDVGLMTAPDGQVYAVAVMIAATRQPVPERQRLMAAVARAVVSAHETATAAR